MKTIWISIFLLVLYSVKKSFTFQMTCECGVRGKGGRIVGGKETMKNEYPWMVAVMDMKANWVQFCGGSVITPWHVLTAAHCTDEVGVNDIGVIVGAHDILNLGEPTNELIKVAKVFVHEEYDKKTYLNDIAIMLTSRKIFFDSYVSPICLPYMNRTLDGDFVKVTGWGLTQHGGKPSAVLREVNLNVITLNECSKKWPGKLARNPPQQICTYRKNKDSCHQDSGGPVVWYDSYINRYIQVALVSFGDDCAGTHPAVNTDVFYFKKWIEKVIFVTKPEERACTLQNIFNPERFLTNFGQVFFGNKLI